MKQKSLGLSILTPLILLLCLSYSGCSGKKVFEPSGKVVVVKNPLIQSLEKISRDYPEVSFQWQDPLDGRSLGEAESPDLLLWVGDWQNFQYLREGKLLDIKKQKRSLAYLKTAPLSRLSYFRNAQDYVIPISVYSWGLFYNKEILTSLEIEPPDTWEEFTSACSKLKENSITPCALGSGFGWPASAWFSYLDIRLNGAKAHEELLRGVRRPTDPSVLAALDLYLYLGREGYFSPDASSKGWIESLNDLMNGKAGFLLLGGFAWDRVDKTKGVGWIPFPEIGKRESDRGELGQMLGFAFFFDTENMEGSIALAEIFIQKGAPGMSGSSFRTLLVPGESLPPAAGSAEILMEASHLLPSLERWGSPQFVQQGLILFRDSLSAPTKWTKETLAERLDFLWVKE